MKATTRGFERATKVWNRIVVDRTTEMSSWVDACKKIQRRGVTIYGYFNSHYAGFGPGSVRLFRDMCTKNGLEIPPVVSTRHRVNAIRLKLQLFGDKHHAERLRV
jgi:hypothetical protein